MRKQTALNIILITVCLLGGAHQSVATIRYVAKDNPNSEEPYNTWTIAASNLQEGVTYASGGETVLVAEATYDVGGKAATGHALTNRLFIDEAISVMSSNNNPEATIIQGAWDPVTTNGPAAVRGVMLINLTGAKLIGFTVRDGATLTSTSGNAADIDGGGIYGGFRVVVSNCIIVGNSAYGNGGGVLSGTVYDSVITSNSATLGSGSYEGVVLNSVVTHNTASTQKTATTKGGGGFRADFRDCILAYNYAGTGGGGALGSYRNCLIYGNEAYYGGGVHNGSLYSCTVVGNHARSSTRGGGVAAEYSSSFAAVNCVIYSNRSVAAHLNWTVDGTSAGFFTNTSTYPKQTGWDASNFTNDPALLAYGSDFGLNHVAGDYHLSRRSLCINAGTNETWMNDAVDLDGQPRLDVFNGTVDMGCYEYVTRGTMITIN